MHIGIDLSVLQGGSAFRGMGRNSFQLINAILQRDTQHHYTLFSQPAAQRSPMLDRVHQGTHVEMVTLPFAEAGLLNRPHSAVEEAAYGQALARFASERRFDLLHLPCFDDADYYYVPLTWEVCPLVMSVYDLIPYHYPDYYLSHPASLERYTACLKLLRRADALIANSDTTRQEIARYLRLDADRITVAPPYADPRFKSGARHARPLTEHTFNITGVYLYTITGMHLSKNIAGLLHLFAALTRLYPTPLQLVISAGIARHQVPQPVEALVETLGIADRVIWTGYTDDATIASLYRGARAYIHASLEEGFGLPIIEAMQMGTPVIAAGRGAMLEAAGGAALLIDPLQPQAAAVQIAEWLDQPASDADRQAGYAQAERFNPARMAQAGLAAYQRAVTPVSPPATESSVSAAIWTPLPPQKSGIADYADALLTELVPRTGEVIVYTGQDADRERLARLLSIPVCAYGTWALNQALGLHTPAVHVYHMGNNVDFHAIIYQQMQQEPGIVVLHDLSLFGFFSFLYWHRGEHRQMIQDVTYSHGQAAANQTAGMLDGTVRFDLLDVSMLGRVLDYSTAVIVHSQFASAFIRQRYSRQARPIVTIPHGAALIADDPALHAAGRAALGLNETHFVIGLFGSIVLSKRIDPALRAVTTLAADYPHLRVLVAGFDGSDYAAALREALSHSPIADRVVWIGETDLAQFVALMRLCDVIVNLRYPNNGEMSGTFMRALGMGKVIITSDLPQFAEFPDAFVWRVPATPDSEEQAGLIARMRQALDDPDGLHAASGRARDFVRQHATWAAVADRHAEVIAKAAQRASRAVRSAHPALALTLPHADGSLGVTVIGDLHGDYGHSQACRSLVKAMRAAGIALSYIEFAYDTSSRTTWFDDPPHGARYPIQLFVCNAPQILQAREQFGAALFEGRYNIGYWYYELPKLPDDWLGAFDLIDEVWVSTRFVHDLTIRSAPVPVHVLPPAIEAGRLSGITRHDFPGWDADRFTFLFSFSVLASSARKNPFGVISAFRQACTQLDPAHLPLLILKAHFLRDYPILLTAIVEAIGDLPVLLITDNLSREQTDALIGLCDAYISLHRSEGLGLGIVEAMALGKPVIATDWSGSSDFLSPEHSYPVRYQIVTISDDHHQFQESHKVLYRPGTSQWAEPDIAHAAALIVELFLNPVEAARRGTQAARFMARQYDVQTRGTAIRQRLELICPAHAQHAVRHVTPALPAPHPQPGDMPVVVDFHRLHEKTHAIQRAFAQWDAIRLRDTDTRLSRIMRRIPLVGYLYRTLVRIRNLGHLEAQAMGVFHAQIEYAHILTDVLRDLEHQTARSESRLQEGMYLRLDDYTARLEKSEHDWARLHQQHADHRTFVQNALFAIERTSEKLRADLEQHYATLDGAIAEVDTHYGDRVRASDAAISGLAAALDERLTALQAAIQVGLDARLLDLVNEQQARFSEQLTSRLAEQHTALGDRLDAAVAEAHERSAQAARDAVEQLGQTRDALLARIADWQQQLAAGLEAGQHATSAVRDQLDARIGQVQEMAVQRFATLTDALESQISTVHQALSEAERALGAVDAAQSDWRAALTGVDDRMRADDEALRQSLDAMQQGHARSHDALHQSQQQIDRRLRITTSGVRLLEQRMAAATSAGQGEHVRREAVSSALLESGGMERALTYIEHHLRLLDAGTTIDVTIAGSHAEALLLAALRYIGDRHRISQPDVWLMIDFTEQWLSSNLLANALSKPALYGRTIVLTDARHTDPVTVAGELFPTFDRVVSPAPDMALRVCVLQKSKLL